MASENEAVAANCSGRQCSETTFAEAIDTIGKDVNNAFQNCPTKNLDVVIMNVGLLWANIKAIEAAHKREVAGLVANLDALEKAVERVCSRDEVDEIVETKKEIQNERK